MSVELDGRAAIVTGGSSGIGRAIALALGAAGMDVWLVGRSETALQATADAIGGGRARIAAMDVGMPGSLADLIASVDHPRLFALVNCAGVMYPEPIMVADPARWRELFDVNVLATLEGAQAAARRFRARGGAGHIVNFSSLTARWEAGGVYGASKIAVEMIGRSLRKELERVDIRVTTIVPGGFATNLARGFPPEMLEAMGRTVEQMGVSPEQVMGDPAHVAKLVRYVLEQPPEVNLGEIVIRPPVDLTL